MHLLPPHQSTLAVQILTQAFESNPSALWVIKKDRKVQQRLKALIEYAVNIGKLNDGVFLSDDCTTVAICFREPSSIRLRHYYEQIKLICRAIGILRVPFVLQRERYLKKHRSIEPHLNFWFLGVLPNTKKSVGVYDLKKGIFEMSKKLQLPILLETSVERNKTVYEYFGFKVYHSWSPTKNYTLWFMKKECE